MNHINPTNLLDNLKIVTYRGIKCINTFPLELVWGKQNSFLECKNCAEYATYKNIIIGMCVNCAKHHYNGNYGSGYYINLTGKTSLALSFGKLNTNDVINKLKSINLNNISYSYPNSNNSIHVFSIYDMAIRLSKNDINLLLKKYNYGWIEFYKYYFNNTNNTNDEDDENENKTEYKYDYETDYETDLKCIINIVIDIQNKYNFKKKSGSIIYKNVKKILFNKEFYEECCEKELIFRTANLPKVKTKQLLDVKYNKNKCEYCNISNKTNKKIDLQKCENCKYCHYCSIACQTRDWKSHKNHCKDLQIKLYYMNSPMEDVD
jgi:hypothetical protein